MRVHTPQILYNVVHKTRDNRAIYYIRYTYTHTQNNSPTADIDHIHTNAFNIISIIMIIILSLYIAVTNYLFVVLLFNFAGSKYAM